MSLIPVPPPRAGQWEVRDDRAVTTVPIPSRGLVAVVDSSGTVRASSDAALSADTVMADVWPSIDLGRPGATQVVDGGDVTVLRLDDSSLVVDIEPQLDDELATLRWLDEQRTSLRDAGAIADAGAGVAAAVGELLGVDAVEVRSFDAPTLRWTAPMIEAGPAPVDDLDEVARRWSESAHLVADVEQAPRIGDLDLGRSAIAQPADTVLPAGVGAVASFPLRHDGAHRGEVVGWAAAPIGPRGLRVRQAIAALVYDLAARGARERRREDDPCGVLEAIGHDLRSPLRAVANYAELLAVPDQLADDELRAFTSRMHTAAQQANEQLDGLVEFLDAEAPHDRTPIDLHRVLAQIAASWTTSPSVVTFEWSGRLLPPLAHPSLAQALAIIVENSVAVRRRAEPITITVRTESMVAGGCRIVVVDDGPGVLRGISAFRWTDGSRSPATVGPVLARHIVELQGGRMTVEAEPEVATTWTLELPAG